MIVTSSGWFSENKQKLLEKLFPFPISPAEGFVSTTLSISNKGCSESKNYGNRDFERQYYGDSIQRHHYSACNKYFNVRPTSQFQDQPTSRRPLATWQNENEIFIPRPVPTGPNKQERSLLNKAAIMKHIHPNCNTDKVLKIAKKIVHMMQFIHFTR